MNFDKWWENFGYFEYKNTSDTVEVARASWDKCKEEVLKIIFLNTKQNGHKSIDVNKLAEEIEKL